MDETPAAPATDLADVRDIVERAVKVVTDMGKALADATVKARLLNGRVAELLDLTAEMAPGPAGAWNPNPGVGGSVTVAEAIGQALGTASMAWTPRPEGVFDSAEAVRVHDGIMAWLSDWRDEQVREANEATARKIVAMLEQARNRRVHGVGVLAGFDLCIELIKEGLE